MPVANAVRPSMTTGISRRIVMLFFMLGAFGSAAMAGTSEPAEGETAVRNALVAYHLALTSGDIAKLEALVTADQRFSMLEGKHSNWGWADYRDNHLLPELDGLAKVDLTLDIREIHIDGGMALAIFTYAITPKGDPTQNFGTAWATAILIRENGEWLIRHLHTS